MPPPSPVAAEGGIRIRHLARLTQVSGVYSSWRFAYPGQCRGQPAASRTPTLGAAHRSASVLCQFPGRGTGNLLNFPDPNPYKPGNMLRRLLPAAGILVILVALGSMNLFERFIFFPEPTLIGTPSAVGLAYEDVEFTADDGTALHGWHVIGARPETLVWFHGNAGNISDRLDNLRLLHDHVGTNIFIFDYRQYGRSKGVASEKGLYSDARGALTYLRTRSDVLQDKIIYFGRSLGSAVALDLAITAPPRGLILESAFLSVREMARTILPGPLGNLAPAGFDNFGKIPQLRSPSLFIHGDRDEIVPYAHGRRLFEAAPPPKAFYTVRGAGHNDTYAIGGSTYFQHIRDFIDGLADQEARGQPLVE